MENSQKKPHFTNKHKQSELFDRVIPEHEKENTHLSGTSHSPNSGNDIPESARIDEEKDVHIFEQLLTEIKKGIKSLIEYNISGQIQRYNFKSSPIQQNRSQTLSYPEQHNERRKSGNENVNAFRNRSTDGHDKNATHNVPKDILERSYNNPNFFSSAHSKHHTKELIGTSIGHEPPDATPSHSDIPGRYFHFEMDDDRDSPTQPVHRSNKSEPSTTNRPNEMFEPSPASGKNPSENSAKPVSINNSTPASQTPTVKKINDAL